MRFKEFITDSYSSILPELMENSLYTTKAERDNLLKDKNKIVEAFIFNFIGMLGLLNANSRPNDLAILRRYFMTDKKVQLANIGDENNDMSLTLKLVQEAGLFRNDAVVNKITRFLAKVKLGQITSVDSVIIAEWLKALKPEFVQSIKDPQVRKLVFDFIKDGGDTIDVSSIAVLMKRKVKKLEMAGEFGVFAKRFKLVKRTPAEVLAMTGGSPIAPLATTDPVADSSAAKSVAADNNNTKDQMTSVTPDPIQSGIAADGVSVTNKKQKADKKIKAPAPVPEPIIGLSTKLNTDAILSNRFNFFQSSAGKQPIERFKNDIRKVSKNALGKKGDLEYFTKFYENEYVKITEIISGLYDFKHTSVTDVINEIRDIINKTKIFDKEVTSKDIITSVVKAYSLRIVNSSTRGMILKLVYEKENGIVADYSGSDIFLLIELLETSKFKVKSQIITDLISQITLVDWAGYGSVTWNALVTSPSYKGLISYLLIATLGSKSLIDMVDYVEDNINKYSREKVFKRISDFVIANGISIAKDIPNEMFGIAIRKTLQNHNKEFFSSNADDPKITKFFVSLLDNRYDSYSTPDYNKQLVDLIIKKYKTDILSNGIANSQYLKDTKDYYGLRSNKVILKLLNDLGVKIDDLLKKFPDDRNVLEIKIQESGIDSLPVKMLKKYITDDTLKNRRYNSPSDEENFKNSPSFATDISNNIKYLLSKTNDTDKLTKIYIEFIEDNPAIYDNSGTFKSIMKLIPKMEKQEVIELAKIAKKNNFKNFFNPSAFTNVSKRDEKDEFVSVFTGILNDSIGTEVEDYFADILEEMPGGVIYKIRSSLVGIQNLIQEVNTGVIQPFGTIDDKRLKIMLSMNDINFSALVTADVGRKKKAERWSDYFKRARDAAGLSSGKSILGNEKVQLIKADEKEITKTYNKSFRSGNHGDVYTKFNKVYSASLKYPEFDEFRKNNFGDGTITPAFHGTGGIAATMILRYGFKVIKSSDSSVVGRMLGDGIYFSNKLDKAMQYVSNSGYGRNVGSKGYILEVDNTLGKLGSGSNSPDYRVMGLGGDRIRSPEWCVRDPKKQLAITKVYEVELSNERLIKEYLNEDKGFKGFKDYLQERAMLNMDTGITTFTFRDGLIPVFVKNEETKELVLSYVDFEDALNEKLIPTSFIDYSSQGPVVVFDNTKKTQGFDIRFAEVMIKDEFSVYEQLFIEKIIDQSI
jgi:hypothetical protein